MMKLLPFGNLHFKTRVIVELTIQLKGGHTNFRTEDDRSRGNKR